jgi:hypothetical protein
MKRNLCIGRLIGVLAGLAGVLLTFGAATPPPLAVRVPLPSGGSGLASPALAAGGGMPGWQIAMIAIGAALLAAVTAVVLDRARAARHTAPAEGT